MTGMPRRTAFCTDLPSALESGNETTKPSGFEATALSMSFAISGISKVAGARYWTSAPVSRAAASTPFLTIDQNGSFCCPWLTTMILTSAASATGAANGAATREAAAARRAKAPKFAIFIGCVFLL